MRVTFFAPPGDVKQNKDDQCVAFILKERLEEMAKLYDNVVLILVFYPSHST